MALPSRRRLAGRTRGVRAGAGSRARSPAVPPAPAAPLAADEGPLTAAGPEPESVSQACPQCGADVMTGAEFCGACGASMGAKRQRKFRPGEITRKYETKRRGKQIAGGKNVLLILGLLHLVGGILIYLIFRGVAAAALAVIEQDPELAVTAEEVEAIRWAAQNFGILVMLEYGLPGIIFTGLYVWARTNPYPACVAGLITYITFLVAALVLNPAALFSIVGWLIRIAIIGALAAAIRASSTDRQLKARGLADTRHPVRRRRPRPT